MSPVQGGIHHKRSSSGWWRPLTIIKLFSSPAFRPAVLRLAAIVPLYQLLQDRVYEPVVVDAMTEAYERALIALGLRNREDPITRLVARRVLDLVDEGIRNPDKIYDRVVAEFGTKQ